MNEGDYGRAEVVSGSEKPSGSSSFLIIRSVYPAVIGINKNELVMQFSDLYPRLC